ncbi:MAG: thioredoxin family protein, partial [Spongiibacteraceae bacterium]
FVELSQQQEPLFLNVTADWCITCLANEKVALSSERVKQHFVDHDIRYVKADWTNQSDDITKLLARYGHSGVPLYVFFPGNNQQPVILPQLLTEDGLLSHLTDDKNAASL